MSEIVVFGHPSLTTKSVNVESIDDYIVSLTKKMIQIMYDAPGVGLAAPQIGINKNIFVFDAGDGPKVAINPKLDDLQGSVVFMEGCLSLPGYYWDIDRYEYAKVSCLNQNGEEVIYEGEDLLGRVLQHEYDHLQGQLLLKQLNRKVRKEALKEISIKGFPRPLLTGSVVTTVIDSSELLTVARYGILLKSDPKKYLYFVTWKTFYRNFF